MPVSIEQHVEWIGDCLAYLRTHGIDTIEADQHAADAWTEHVQVVANKTLYPKAASWYMGANIPGKRHAVQFYMAGLGAYRQLLADEAAAGFPAFGLDRAPATVGV